MSIHWHYKLINLIISVQEGLMWNMMLIEVYSCLAFKAAKAKKGSGFSAAGYSHAVSLCVYIYTLALPTGQDGKWKVLTGGGGRELLDCFVHTLGPLMGLWPKRGPIVSNNFTVADSLWHSFTTLCFTFSNVARCSHSICQVGVFNFYFLFHPKCLFSMQ